MGKSNSKSNVLLVYPENLRAYLPTFRTEFIDLQKLSQDQLQALGHGLIRTALTILRYYEDENQLNSSILQILKSLNPYLESNLVYAIFVYLLHSSKLDKEKLRIELEQFPETLNEKVMSIYDELILEGRNKGIEEGIEKEWAGLKTLRVNRKTIQEKGKKLFRN